jgi:hypothetical protein
LTATLLHTVPVSSFPRPRVGLLTALLLGAVALSGCSALQRNKPYPPQERFASGETFSRLFDAPPAAVCRSARLALLSQGYLVTVNDPALVEGKKNFQPDVGSHIEMMIRVVCVPDGDGAISMAFAAAVQETYTVRRVSNSASVGVGSVGSLSVPFGETSEGLTRVGSQTIQLGEFYDRLFTLIKSYIAMDSVPAAAASTPATTPSP